MIAPDYRGAGHSWRPAGGYDKRTMAGDLDRLLREHLGVAGPVAVVGHDIGLMVAYAYAREYDASQLVVVDAPLPGTEEMMREVAEHVTGVRVPGTAHWVPEENPQAFTRALLDFL